MGDSELAAVLAERVEPDVLVVELVNRAERAAAGDDITAILIDVSS